MALNARYVHTNLTVRDWRRVAAFYCDVFGCVPQPPERHLSGDWIDRLTTLPGARIRGLHLVLPGFPPGGPTLEIFSYDEMTAAARPVTNEPGFGHLAFAVNDVEAAVTAVLAAGGGRVGEVATAAVAGVGTLRVAYVRDPEGNILELQNWSLTR